MLLIDSAMDSTWSKCKLLDSNNKIMSSQDGSVAKIGMETSQEEFHSLFHSDQGFGRILLSVEKK